MWATGVWISTLLGHSHTYSLLRSCCDQLFQPIAEVATRSPGDPGERSWDVLIRKSELAIFFNMIKRVFATDLMADRSCQFTTNMDIIGARLSLKLNTNSPYFGFEIVFILIIFNIDGYLSNSYVNFGSGTKLVVPFVTFLIAHWSRNKMVPSERSPTNWGLATDQWKLLFELVGDRSVTVTKLFSNQLLQLQEESPWGNRQVADHLQS